MAFRSLLSGCLAVGLLAGFAACNKELPKPATVPTTETVAPVEPAGPPVFEDVTAKTGIDFTYRNGEEADNYAIIESVGGGVALFDYDGDGLLDIFLPGGGKYEGKTVLGNPCKLYRNLGNFTFEDVTAVAGLGGPFQYTHGAAAFDYDCDGFPDLLLTGYNRLVLLHNEPVAGGGRKFVDVTKKAGLTDTLWSTSAGWGDLDGDGYPEIYVCHYGDWDFNTNHPTDCTYDGKTRDVCQPRKFQPLPHTLYRNNKDGTFTDVSAKIAVPKKGHGMGVLFVDVNGDGRPDIYVANDTDDNFLFMNRGKPGELTLQEVGRSAGVALDERGGPNGSMGVDAADFDRSGLPSIMVTNYENELPALYQNRSANGGERFTYATMMTGLSAINGVYVSWGTGFFDFDRDGWEDLMIVSGHAIRFPHKTDRRQLPTLLRNDKGRFAVVSKTGGSYFTAPHNARGAAFGDLDNDGKTDVVISHLNEPVAVLRNVAPTGDRHWLGVELVGKANRDIVGARVVFEGKAATQTRFVKGGAGFACTHDKRLLFGLGDDTTADAVTVHWLNGLTVKYAGLAPDAYWKITEGEATAKKVTK